VKEYYQILEDTLIGFFLWPYDRTERKKKRPKFFFFDCGVVRAVQNRLSDPPTAAETGHLFETWFVNELVCLRDYQAKDHEFSFWRDRNHELDIVVSKANQPILAIECKSGKTDLSAGTVQRFRQSFPNTAIVVASLADTRARRIGDVDVLPWKQALARYAELG
jgi:predicted AAA+ superfamily ATPase